MAKEKPRVDDKQNDDATISKRKLTVEVDIPDKCEFITCQVCGHKNTIDTGLCVMCSNYLFK